MSRYNIKPAGEMMQQGWVLLDIRPPVGETSSLI
jgi:hypothetical protein